MRPYIHVRRSKPTKEASQRTIGNSTSTVRKRSKADAGEEEEARVGKEVGRVLRPASVLGQSQDQGMRVSGRWVGTSTGGWVGTFSRAVIRMVSSESLSQGFDSQMRRWVSMISSWRRR